MKRSGLILSLALAFCACAGAGRAIDQVGENSVGAGLAAGLGAGVGLLIPGLGAAYGAALSLGGFLCALFSRPAAQVAGTSAPAAGFPWSMLLLAGLVVLALRGWAHWPTVLRPAWQTVKVAARAFLGGRSPK